MVFPIAGGTQDTGYEISNSLRFNDDDNPNLTFTPSSAVTSERKTFTISCWVKRGSNFGTTEFMWEMGGNDNANERIIARFDSNNRLNVNDSSTAFRIPNRLFRDPSAWYHIVVAFDTTDSTADNRVKVYVNGVQETSFLTSNNPGQNDTKGFSHNSEHTIGRTNIDNGSPFDGYMTEFHAVGGSQLDATAFGKFNENGVWIPKKYTGSHGTNGFYLEFKQTGTSQNSSGIGADTSGNDNHFAVSNLAATDVTTDTCTNNFCTGNPIAKYINDTNVTFSEGNVKGVAGAVATSYNFLGTFGSANMNFYFEAKATNVDQNNDTRIGVVPVDSTAGIAINGEHNQVVYRGDGSVVSTGETALTSQGNITDGMIVGVAVDPDNNVKWYLNGTLTSTQSINSTYRGPVYMPYFRHVNSGTVEFNFGNPSFSISSGNSDANGYGNFEYAPPSGYYSICTKNLAEYG